MAICSPSSMASSGSGGSGSSKVWIVHGLVLGAAVVAAGAYAAFFFRPGGRFQSRVVGIIPARFASTRFEGKSLVEILGKPMIQVGVGLIAFQQLGGINGIVFYASQTFVSAGFPSGDLGTLMMGVIQVPITMVGAILMDKSGRKPLVMVSAAGTFIGMFLVGVSFYLKGQGWQMDWVPFLGLIGILEKFSDVVAWLKTKAPRERKRGATKM